ncbi:MAG: fructosamine kinase family protein [Raineya sp.]|nr:fructosamine kinase family protein [Raineya sp.]
MFGFEPNDFLEAVFVQSFGKLPVLEHFQAVSGGCINNAAKVATDRGTFFIKWNENTPEDTFEIEIKGLQKLASCGIPTPQVIASGRVQGKNYLLLEYLEGYPNKTFWKDLGRHLAELHQNTSDFFGLEYDNYIGALRQTNTPTRNGIEFFIEQRLKVQAGLAFYNRLIEKSFLEKLNKLYEKLPNLLPNEKPALLHGDLWSGNVITHNKGYAVVIDPAIYYGLREAEIAFTQLFGGFEADFYDSYNYHFPLQKDFVERASIYNLYPLFVHLNLFGKSYLPAIERIVDRFV